MRNQAVKNLVGTGILEDKRAFSTDTLYKRFLRPCKDEYGLKPDGLWYAMGSSWFDWCIGEDFGGLGKYIYEVELNPKANILFLTTKKEVFSFSEKYVNKDRTFSPFTSIYIDWEKVSKDYDGIEVNPYIGELLQKKELF